ncbi:MAG: ABC transporter permease [Lachnospiraceae bacterium]|nr:ABC transporter permease [Lachnospiraceae bacterium]
MNGKEQSGKWNQIDISSITPILGLIFVFILFAILTKGSNFRTSNLEVIVSQAFIYCVIGVGAMFVYSYGGFDFNIGSTMGICSIIISALVVKNPNAILPALLLSCLFGLFSGFLVGAVTQYLGLSSFIASLCFSYIWRGMCQVILGYSQLAMPAEFCSKLNGSMLKVIVLVVMFVAGTFFLNRTRLGKYQKAIGGNPVVSDLSGVNVKKYVIAAHMVLGLCAGIAALFSVARAAQVYPQSGNGYDMNVLIACVLGGLPLGGGNGCKMRSVFVGAITVAVLTNGLTLVGVDPNIIDGIKGAIFIVVVTMSYRRERGVEIK